MKLKAHSNMRRLSTSVKTPPVFPGGTASFRIITSIACVLAVLTLLSFIPALPVMAAATLTLTPYSGQTGTVITVTGSGYTINASGYIWFDTDGDGTRDGEEPQTAVTILSNGSIPSGTTLTAPSTTPGLYYVKADIPSGGAIEANATFYCPQIALSVSSGPPGTVVTITGNYFRPNTYGYVHFDTNKNGLRDAGEPSSAFIQTTATGYLPSGITLTIPGTASGSYNIIANIPTSLPYVDASAPFTVIALNPAISLSPASGYTGTVITISGNDFTTSTAGYIWFDIDGDNIIDAGEPQTAVTTTASGTIPSGTTLTAPLVTPGAYQVRADIPNGGSVEASATFNFLITIFLSPSSGSVGTVITVTGAGFSANTTGYIWFDTDGDSAMDGEEPQTAVTSTDNGSIPAGITLTVPDVEPVSPYQVRADIPSGGSVETSATFTTTATSLWLTVVKYDAYGAVIGSQTVTYQWMEANLTVYGDTSTHRYAQGPSFDDTDFNTLWDPGETVNVDSRDYGRVKGSDVKDLCNLVGGASAGDTIKIQASDGFNKWFDYEDIYSPEPEQGKLIVCWHNSDFGGYPPAYDSGMRLIFFAETQNPAGKYTFGNWDMHETLPPSRWHYFYDGTFWPSSSGLSVQYVYRIEIHQPGLVSCDISGNPKDVFTAGDTVYVKGIGLAASRNYKIWIQNEPVLQNPLNGMDQPSGNTYVFAAGGDPSGAQETVTTDGSGNFGPAAIWSIPTSAAAQEYDIVADNQVSGTVGTFDTADAIDNPGWKGFAVTALVEFISFTITDYNNDGIQFGRLLQGDVDQPADWNEVVGAVTITVGTETNIDVDIQVMGDHFTGDSGYIPIENLKYNDADAVEGAVPLTDTYVTWYTVNVPLAVDSVTQVYYWLTIPVDLPNGDYFSTLYYKAITAS